MVTDVTPALRATLAEKLAESLTGTIPAGTPRLLHGTVALPGKATAVVGMRRAGKTTFLHQLRRERLESGVCADPTVAAVSERELRALTEAERLFTNATRRLLTLTLDSVPSEVPAGVVVQPAYEWLLAGPSEA
jgi:hypothetical protein